MVRRSRLLWPLLLTALIAAFFILLQQLDLSRDRPHIDRKSVV